MDYVVNFVCGMIFLWVSLKAISKFATIYFHHSLINRYSKLTLDRRLQIAQTCIDDEVAYVSRWIQVEGEETENDLRLRRQIENLMEVRGRATNESVAREVFLKTLRDRVNSDDGLDNAHREYIEFKARLAA